MVVPCIRAVPATWFSVPTTFLVKSFSKRFSSLRVMGPVNMSSSDKIPPVLGSPSATDTEGVAAEVTVAATAEATEASAPDAVVADVADASGVVDGAAPTVAAPKVAAGGRYSDAVVAAMTEDQLWTAVSAGLLTSGQMTRGLR